MKKLLLAIPAVALLAASCSGSSQTLVQPPPATQNAPAPQTQTQTRQDAGQPDYTPASMKTYVSASQHYSFQYPSNWFLNGQGTDDSDIHITSKELNGGELSSDTVTVEIQTFHTKKASDKLVDLAKKDIAAAAGSMGPSGAVTATTINGHAAVKVEHAGGEGADGPGYYIQRDDTHYLFVLVYGSTQMDAVNQIVSSITF